MSVLIKNMEIPEHCGYCRFRYDGICHALQKTQYSVEECPLVSVNDISAAPTIEPQQWIPVSSGLLPKAEHGEGEDVLCQLENMRRIVLYFDGGNWCYPSGEPYIGVNYENGWSNKVIAWMPLPAPMEGGAEMKGEENDN